MPQEVQASLLRVLQEKEIYRIGDTKTRKVNARVIAATNKDLKTLVDDGRFRLDLFYRLKVITIELPALRERIEDILDLAPYFLNKICKSAGRVTPDVSDAVYSRLLSYPWPGSIRELENCMESMIAMTDGTVLTEEDIPEEIR
jgi:DNA-binding NtrC family response regulator